MTAIPGFDPDKSYVYDVTVAAVITIAPDTEPGVDELKEALLENFIEYLNDVLDAGDLGYYAKHNLKAELITTVNE